MVAAGGTGGHLFPAQALAEVLIGARLAGRAGHRRAAARPCRQFPAERAIALAGGHLPAGRSRSAHGPGGDHHPARRAAGPARAFRDLDPAIVVGFGGYPSLPALMAAISQGRRTLIHEQNAVMGRANRLLAPGVTAVACAFPTLQKAAAGSRRAVVVGNPVRPEIRAPRTTRPTSRRPTRSAC